ncbi:uncharacterized protein LOC125080498 [Lutra lutra]|uniref:uncharacterized protein LOC125080498 n=1 Tax=Lutra lutra TaxID=9657 RepID=UPI001FD020B6|nr:uncharacterized protein LOC125080498 [Lutra lutra]
MCTLRSLGHSPAAAIIRSLKAQLKTSPSEKPWKAELPQIPAHFAPLLRTVALPRAASPPPAAALPRVALPEWHHSGKRSCPGTDLVSSGLVLGAASSRVASSWEQPHPGSSLAGAASFRGAALSESGLVGSGLIGAASSWERPHLGSGLIQSGLVGSSVMGSRVCVVRAVVLVIIIASSSSGVALSTAASSRAAFLGVALSGSSSSSLSLAEMVAEAMAGDDEILQGEDMEGGEKRTKVDF